MRICASDPKFVSIHLFKGAYYTPVDTYIYNIMLFIVARKCDNYEHSYRDGSCSSL